MDPTTAMNQSDTLITGLIGGLTPDDRERSTPCDEWTVHELVGHMCGGAQMIAGALQGEAMPSDPPDFLADGPVAGWAAASASLSAAATPEALAATHTLPFGEMTGSMAVSVIVADQITHAWDLARATGQELDLGDELAEFALATWQPVIPAEGRTGPGFKAVVEVSDDASTIDRLVAYTGRQP
jgi:uncharacterized protein (TIGR03086 family)